jgi:hypothetical protein
MTIRRMMKIRVLTMTPPINASPVKIDENACPNPPNSRTIAVE